MSERYPRKPNVKCAVCDKQIYKRPSQIKINNGNVYCGSICYGISCREEKPCTICGKSILAGSHKKTCSRACANKQRVGIKYKQNSPKDKVKHYLALKKRLADLKGVVCERCNYDKFKILQVHHKDRNRSNNDLSNLELICPNCHFEEHHL